MRQHSFTFGAAVIALVLCAALPARGQDPACALPVDVGPCDGACPRWYHDSETGRCEEFLWGCCEGNANNFETLEECEAACPPDICSLPPDVGPCAGVCPRWYHDAETGRCEEFNWGCCGGNENNFETLEECEAACPPDICALPMDIGPCDGICPRWYHDAETGGCEPFDWGCCGGNENNFETLEECEAACDPPCPLPGDPRHLLVAREADDVLLTWDDAADALSWDVLRDPWRDPSTWGAPHALGVADADPMASGIQFRDVDAVLADPLLYYLITANNDCGGSTLR